MGTGESPGIVVPTDTQTPHLQCMVRPTAILNLSLAAGPRSGSEFWILGSLGRISITNEAHSTSSSVYPQQTLTTVGIKNILLPAWSPASWSQAIVPLLLFFPFFLSCSHDKQSQDNFIFKSRHISMKEWSLGIFIWWFIYFQLPSTGCWSWVTQLITITRLFFYILSYWLQPNQ